VTYVFDEDDPDMVSGCDLDFAEDETEDDALDLVILTGGSQDLEYVEETLNKYKELFPNA
jgi:hypothetical protein